MNCWGSFGVAVFLIISSYFLGDPVQESNFSLKLYLNKKIYRLWKYYAPCVLITYIIVRLFPLPGRTCELKDLLLNEIFLNGFIGTPYVDGAHWYITVLLSAIVIIGILKKMRIENKAYIYLFWMTTVIIINKVGNEFSMLLGGYAGIICVGICFRKILDSEVSEKWKWWLIAILSEIYVFFCFGSLYALFVLISVFLVYISLNKKIFLPKTLKSVILYIASISYPLYLIHQNISFVIQYQWMNLSGKYTFLYGVVSIIVTVILAILINKFVKKVFQG